MPVTIVNPMNEGLRETGRLRRCEAPGCDAVFVDLSKNRSRRYCDTGNCGNRQHVAAYRERRAARAGRDGSSAVRAAPREGSSAVRAAPRDG